MAVNDIFFVKMNFEAPSGAASTGIYYRESAVRSGAGTDTQIVANSFDAAIAALVRDVLATEWQLTSIWAEKRIVQPSPAFKTIQATQNGTRAGTSLPANNAINVQLHQNAFSSRRDGSMFFPGISETDTTVGTLETVFFNTQVAALRDALAAQLVEVSAGTGRWDPGVISQLILNAAPPAKDWAGAFLPVFNASVSPIIATQRRRQTRVFGQAV